MAIAEQMLTQNTTKNGVCSNENIKDYNFDEFSCTSQFTLIPLKI